MNFYRSLQLGDHFIYFSEQITSVINTESWNNFHCGRLQKSTINIFGKSGYFMENNTQQ